MRSTTGCVTPTSTSGSRRPSSGRSATCCDRGLLRSRLTCGVASDESRCAEHRVLRTRAREGGRASYRERGYDGAWDRLSARALRRQAFGSDWLGTEHLKADHAPSAWWKAERGLPVTLRDVEVLSGSCNSRRGSSRRARPGTRSG